MATAAVQIPSYNRTEAGSCQLKPATFPEPAGPSKADVNKIASEWVESLNKAFESQEYDPIEQLFLQEGTWRDQLGLSWDYHTLNGPEKIITFLKTGPKGCRIKFVSIDDSNSLRKPNVSAVDFNGQVNGIASFLTVETDVGRGRGLVRLVQDHDGKWKAFTLFSSMTELKGHEEKTGGNRPDGVEHGGRPGRKNWQEKRTAVENFEGEEEPTVLILG